MKKTAGQKIARLVELQKQFEKNADGVTLAEHFEFSSLVKELQELKILRIEKTDKHNIVVYHFDGPGNSEESFK